MNNDANNIYQRYINVIKNVFYSMNIKNNEFISFIENINKNNIKISDKELYTKLNNIYKSLNSNSEVQEFDRETARSKQLVKFLNKINKKDIKRYLDFGGGDGSLTLSIKNTLNLQNEDVYITDIKKYDTIDKYNLNFVQNNNGVIDLPENSFDLITAYMVFHHIKDDIQEQNIQQLYKLLKPGGILVLREHNLHFKNKYVKKHVVATLDIMHDIYDHVITSELNWKDKGNYYSKYKSKTEWNTLFIKNKFEKIYEPSFYNNLIKNPNLKYNIIYVKPDVSDITNSLQLITDDISDGDSDQNVDTITDITDVTDIIGVDENTDINEDNDVGTIDSLLNIDKDDINKFIDISNISNISTKIQSQFNNLKDGFINTISNINTNDENSDDNDDSDDSDDIDINDNILLSKTENIPIINTEQLNNSDNVPSTEETKTIKIQL
jgi:ubiquinone/menaquinone biosynthesis C-methylase UbiE